MSESFETQIRQKRLKRSIEAYAHIERLERTNAALLAACKATNDWLLDGFFDLSELSEDAKQVLETVRSAIADAEKPEKGAAS